MQIPNLSLEFGGSLKNVPVSYTTLGSLSPSKDNAIVICHALSGSAEVGVWWRSLLEYGAGAALDPSKHFIICMNCLGSPYGTASPLTDRDGDASLGPYGPDFPLTSIRDDVRLFRKVLDRLGVVRIQSVIGGSMGGMHVLEFAHFGTEYVKSIIPIATSASYSAWGIGWGEMQRQCIYIDPRFRDGRYSRNDPPKQGLAAARMAAMLSYRSQKSFQTRFGRKVHDGAIETTAKESQLAPLAVQSYLQYQGTKFVDRFDANCYIALTHKLDTHDISRDRSPTVQDSLATIKQPALILSIETDVLFTIEEQLQLHRWIPNSIHRAIISDDGHDGFLLETDQINRFIGSFLKRLDGNDPVDGTSPTGKSRGLLRSAWQSIATSALWIVSNLNFRGGR
ncbi:homoserine O-acetyltransferase [Aspergillus aculeatinus CBS 121060]|uniref:Homoserine O-acetyltransferase n=1 Tax=Aspergillus aculeatinus CBS 121060 TaxID=1448322 RepID=A0ACD1GX73_9EURO|nr:homoserine O-acetyltransferase [Aspergillus aculeatinus CBS 121060]RAH65876.1 homoserine O-acetyltransferase [Aspergillus aculeatinus CBS 121060]